MNITTTTYSAGAGIILFTFLNNYYKYNFLCSRVYLSYCLSEK